ncbi:MAG: cation:proton antiporter [Bacillota bacterium]
MNESLFTLLFAVLFVAASLISVELAISISIVEIVVGVIGGNFLGLHTTPWLEFLASLGSIVLTFLAGAEVDTEAMRKRLKESLIIGGFSFVAPFLGAWAFAYYVAHWTLRASLIGGIALSTTSLAVVYAVLVETGLNTTAIGQIIMASCFVTDFGTALTLNAIFSELSWKTLVFVLLSALAIYLAPKVSPWLFQRYSERVVEPEIKFIFLVLFFFMFLGAFSGSHAVLPAFIFGLVLSPVFNRNPAVQRKLRIIAFAILTPAFFIKAGFNVSLRDVYLSLFPLAGFLAVKLITKGIGVYPFARRYVPKDAMFTTLLMSTGLTFGTISSTYGLSAGIIDKSQFSILIAVVLLSAVLPTFIAQRWFQPKVVFNGGLRPGAVIDESGRGRGEGR